MVKVDPMPKLALHMQMSLMFFDNLMRQGETEACPFLLGGKEWGEQRIELFGGHPCPGVGQCDEHKRLSRIGRCTEVDMCRRLAQCRLPRHSIASADGQRPPAVMA